MLTVEPVKEKFTTTHRLIWIVCCTISLIHISVHLLIGEREVSWHSKHKAWSASAHLVQSDHCSLVVIRSFNVQRSQFKLWASFVALLWQLDDEMERDVTLPHSRYWAGWRDGTWCYIATLMVLRCHIYVIGLAGEMERGVTLPHLCYWAGWRDRMWCYITTLSLLRWMTRWNVMLCYRMERDVVLPHGTWCFTSWNLMLCYHTERDVTLPHGMWCYVTTWNVMSCYHVERDAVLPHRTWCVTTRNVMLCYHMEWCYVTLIVVTQDLSHQPGGAVVPVLTFPVLWFRHLCGDDFPLFCCLLGLISLTLPNTFVSHAVSSEPGTTLIYASVTDP